MANNYVSFDPTAYPSVSAATDRAQGGFAALADMQRGAEADRRQYSLDRMAHAESMRTAELDAQKFSLEVARDRRAQDNESANMLMTLTRFQQERTLTDLKIVQAQVESSRAVREEAEKIKLTSEGTRPLARAFTPNAGVSALAITQLHGDGSISLLGPKEKERIDAISGNLQTQQVYVGERMHDPLTWAGNLASDDDETRISAQAYFMKSGVPEDQLKRYQRPGDSATARTMLGAVSIGSDSLAGSMRTYATSQLAIDQDREALAELKAREKPSEAETAEIAKLEESLEVSRRAQLSVRRELEKAKLLGDDGQLLTFDQIHTPIVRARAAVTEFAERLNNPSVAAQLFAPRAEATRQIESSTATPEQKQKALELLSTLPDPDRTAKALQALELGAIEVEKYGPVDPRGRRGLAMMTEAISVDLAPVSRSLLGGGFSAADVAGRWNVLTAMGASEADMQNHNSGLGLGRELGAEESVVAEPGTGKAIPYGDALERLNKFLAEGSGRNLPFEKVRDMEVLLKQLDGSTVEVASPSGFPVRVNASAVLRSAEGREAAKRMFGPAVEQMRSEISSIRVDRAFLPFSEVLDSAPTLQNATGAQATEYLLARARQTPQQAVDKALAGEVVAMQGASIPKASWGRRLAGGIPNQYWAPLAYLMSGGPARRYLPTAAQADVPRNNVPSVPAGWIPGARDLAEADVIRYQIARVANALESNDQEEVALAYADVAASVETMRGSGREYERFNPASAFEAAGLGGIISAHKKVWDEGGWLKTATDGTSGVWSDRSSAKSDIGKFFAMMSAGPVVPVPLSAATRVTLRESPGSPAPAPAPAPGALVIP